MKLLFIHTGGTISMVRSEVGLLPKSGLVERAVEARLDNKSKLATYVFEPLIDSAHISYQDWNEILDVIDDHPEHRVLITHGTDTMSFTGAALATALAGLKRQIVLCAAMTPLGEGGDAEENLDFALQALAEPNEGVWFAFGGKLLPAHGLVKHHSHASDAFRYVVSPSPKSPRLRRFSEKSIGIFTLSPDFSARAFRAAMMELDGAVLRIYGSGTAPAHPEFLEALRQVRASGKHLRAVSQCEKGGLLPGSYAAGSAFWETGVENGEAQTAEAALIDIWLNAST